jgi:hypothetical protein
VVPPEINSCDGARRQVSEIPLALNSKGVANAAPYIRPLQSLLQSSLPPACPSMFSIESATWDKRKYRELAGSDAAE